MNKKKNILQCLVIALFIIIISLMLYLGDAYKNMIDRERSIKSALENIQEAQDIYNDENNPFPLIYAQRLKDGRIRMYRRYLRSFPNNLAALWLDFPKIDLVKYSAYNGFAKTKETVKTEEETQHRQQRRIETNQKLELKTWELPNHY